MLVAACAIVQLAVNQYLIFAALRATDPAIRARDFIFGPQTLRNDLTEMCMAVLSTLAIAMSLLTVVIALPLATLLQRSALHAQLIKDARTDSKTGLLNAATWERDATAEVTRAVRTRTALAVAMLDIDRFKAINDTYGHLLGDQVIKEIAHTLTALLRDYDLAGRFGGDEFALLLPQTRAVDAFRIAERVRSAISGLCIIAPGANAGERVHVTVSIGVAALDSGSKREYAELMAAADAALYRAKACGRDQVQMISTTRGLSAVSSASARNQRRDHRRPRAEPVPPRRELVRASGRPCPSRSAPAGPRGSWCCRYDTATRSPCSAPPGWRSPGTSSRSPRSARPRRCPAPGRPGSWSRTRSPLASRSGSSPSPWPP